MLVCAAAARGAVATGVDPDPAMLAAARLRVADAGLEATFLEGQVERLPFPDSSFDVVASVTVLCFVGDAAGALREMARVLRPGGRLVLGELGRWSCWAALRRVRGWLGSTTWQKARFRTPGELRALVQQAGLSVTSGTGRRLLPTDRSAGAPARATRSLAGPRNTHRRGVHRARRGQTMTTSEGASGVRLGLRENWQQFSLLVLVNAFVGGMVGLERTVVPLIGSEEFKIASTTVIVSFIVSFGVVKALANLVSGHFADVYGRKSMLVLGWLIGLPVPFMIGWGPSWGWVIAANALLGSQPGLHLVDDGYHEDRPRRA